MSRVYWGTRPWSTKSPPAMGTTGDNGTGIEDEVADNLRVDQIGQADMDTDAAVIQKVAGTGSAVTGEGNHLYDSTAKVRRFHTGSKWVLEDIWNAHHFGLKGDGVTDDTTNFRSLVQTGRNIYFPEGIYLISNGGSGLAGITMPSNVRLFGAGPGKTIFKLANSGECHMFYFSGVTDITVEGIEFDGNRANQSTVGLGILQMEAGCDRIWIDQVRMYNAKGYAIGIQLDTDDCEDISISNFHISGTGQDAIDYKVDATEGQGINIVNGYISNPGNEVGGQAGIDARGTCTITNVQVHNIADNGFSANCGIRIRDNVDSDGKGGKHTVVSNCVVSGAGTTARGFIVGGTGNILSNCVASMTGANAKSILVSGTNTGTAKSQYNAILGCTVTDGEYGVQVDDGAYSTRVRNCDIAGCSGYGIQVQAPDCDVMGNSITDCPTGIRLLGNGAVNNEFTTVTNNVIRDATTGIVVNDSGVVKATIHANIYHNCTANISDSGTTTRIVDLSTGGTVGGLDPD